MRYIDIITSDLLVFRITLIFSDKIKSDLKERYRRNFASDDRNLDELIRPNIERTLDETSDEIYNEVSDEMKEQIITYIITNSRVTLDQDNRTGRGNFNLMRILLEYPVLMDNPMLLVEIMRTSQHRIALMVDLYVHSR